MGSEDGFAGTSAACSVMVVVETLAAREEKPFPPKKRPISVQWPR